jgi:hypothetical protein
MQKMDLSLIIIRELFPFRNSRPAVSNGFLTLWVAKLVRGYCFFAIQPRRKRRGILARNNKRDMKNQLNGRMGDNYDYFFTHGTQEWNEYSKHPNHQETGIIASDLATEKKIPLLQFCYYPIYGSGTSTVANVANKDRARYYFQLDYEELKFKLKLIDCFQGEMGNLANLAYPCPNPECFESVINSTNTPFIKK